MKQWISILSIIVGFLGACQKENSSQEPPIDWATVDCAYVNLDSLLEPIDTVWCDGQMQVIEPMTKEILEPLVVDPTCGYYIAGKVKYYTFGIPHAIIDYNLGNGRASKVTYVRHNSGAPWENVRHGCYFQQPCDGVDNNDPQ